MKLWQIIKTVLYVLGGLIILIFHKAINNFIGITVGIVVLLYGIDIAIVSAISKKHIGEN